MKIRILAFVVLLPLCLLFSACSKNKDTTMRFGMGTVAHIEKTVDAEGATNGSIENAQTFAAVLLDSDGRVADCVLDAVDFYLSFTEKGEYVEPPAIKSKYAQGESYGMKAYGNAVKEWYQQADAFAQTVKGKTLSEIQALVAANGKGTDELINAGCTIAITDFVRAVEKAINAAESGTQTQSGTLRLTVSCEHIDGKSAAAAENGNSTVRTTATVNVVDVNNNTLHTETDTVTSTAEFTSEGKAVTQTGDLPTDD